MLGNGLIYSYERVWYPVHPALTEQGPYLVVLVELPAADNVRVVGNLLGDPRQSVDLGGEVQPVFSIIMRLTLFSPYCSGNHFSPTGQNA